MQLSWSNLRQICQSCHIKDVDLPFALKRSPEVTKRYLLDPFRQDPDRMKNMLFPPGTRHEYLIRLNEYPYDLERGIEHWVFWVRPDVGNN